MNPLRNVATSNLRKKFLKLFSLLGIFLRVEKITGHRGNMLQEPRKLASSLEDIPGFHSTRATRIQDNHASWKRTLTAYGAETRRQFKVHEEGQRIIRMKRVKSAPHPGLNDNNDSRRESNEDRLLPRRCVSEQGYRTMEMRPVSPNRASRLRTEHITELRSLNRYSALTKMKDYHHCMRENRPSHSARYPRFIPNEKRNIDPEWGTKEYDIHIYHCQRDRRWVSKWLQGPLEAKRFNVKMKTICYEKSKKIPNESLGSSRIILVLTPDFINMGLELLEDTTFCSHVLVVRLRECSIPEELNFTSYVDLSFKDMTDTTLQNRLLPKLIATLQLPKSICS